MLYITAAPQRRYRGQNKLLENCIVYMYKNKGSPRKEEVLSPGATFDTDLLVLALALFQLEREKILREGKRFTVLYFIYGPQA